MLKDKGSELYSGYEVSACHCCVATLGLSALVWLPETTATGASVQLYSSGEWRP